MRNWVKIVFPIIGLLYCIAFLEIDLPGGGVHQTWNDQYDTYIAAQNNNDVPSADQPVDLHAANSSIPLITSIVPTVGGVVAIFVPVFISLDNSSGIYLKNCTLII